MMETTYRLIVIGSTGMYSYGDDAQSAELARLCPGAMQLGRRLGIERCLWTEDGRGRRCLESRTLIDAEPEPGAWGISAARQEVRG